MNRKTALEQLEHWIEQYYRINGTPTLDDIKGQINLLKDYEREQLYIANVSRRFTCDHCNEDWEVDYKCDKCSDKGMVSWRPNSTNLIDNT